MKNKIKESIKAFAKGDFYENALSFFGDALLYPTKKRMRIPVNIENIKIKTIDLLFQITNNVINDIKDEFDNTINENTILKSYLFFSVELENKNYNKTELSNITREINKVYKVPIMVLFKYNNFLTIAIQDRRVNKTDSDKHVLEKVTLIKDIDINNPHRGHIEILADLSFINLYENHKFKTFEELHKAWQKTLDINELNKKFYKELSNWYFWATKEVYFPSESIESDKKVLFSDDEKVKEHNAKNLIRLLTRLLFVWFIKEKDLIPENIFDIKYIENELLTEFKPNAERSSNPKENNSNYYKGVLQNLFFATLNREMKKREFRKDGQHKNVTNLMRYEKYFKNPDIFIKLVEEKVPFLNGGLFECLDKPDPKKKGPKGGDVIIYEDCFSDSDKNEINVPDYIFFCGERIVDLSDELGIKDNNSKKAKVKGLINILNSYKFTVDENTPLEEESALDPELLGKVFENLLASYNPETKTTARKQTGSFYTPREIVNYMVDESLIAYLKDKLINTPKVYLELGEKQTQMFDITEKKNKQLAITEDLHKTRWEDNETELENELRKLFSYNQEKHPFLDNELNILIKGLNECKILDPACGSGAFPMGILHKMVHVLEKIDPNNFKWEKEQREKTIGDKIKELEEDKEAIKGLKDEEVRNKAINAVDEKLKDIEEIFNSENNFDNYSRKLFLIENCIYGLDIQPIAIQISKLRVFISLIVDQITDKSKDNFGIRPLPNLETKFIAANTLIGINKPKEQRNIFQTEEINKLEKDLKDNRHKLFSSKSPSKKREFREKDKELREKMADFLIDMGWGNDTANKLANWDPYDQNASCDFFDMEWMFGIKDPLISKGQSGFELVIGNPPYLRIQGVKESNPDFIPYAKKNFVSASKGNWDLYVLFNEKGFLLLKNKGILSYIQPHKFFQADFAEGIRDFIAEKKSLLKIVNFGAEQVFESATNYTCLFFLQKAEREKFEFIDVENTLDWLKDQNNFKFKNIILQPKIKEKWNFNSDKKQAIFTKIKQNNKTLGDITKKIFQGIATSADKIYVLEVKNEKDDILTCYSKSLEMEIKIEKGLVKAFLMGKDVKRYSVVKAKNVVIFPYIIEENKSTFMTQEHIKTNFPLGWDYLLKNRESLEKRENGKFINTWWQFSRPQSMTDFQYPKIMTPDIAIKPELTIDLNGTFYHTTTIYSFVFDINLKEDRSYWLGLLNSNLFWFFISGTGNVLRGGYFRFKSEYLKPFPIKRINFENQIELNYHKQIIFWVDQILEKKKNNEETKELEDKIDSIVYKLYGLTYEEVKIVKPDFILSEAEFKKDVFV